ncbi:MAG TPA: glycosyltransferase family 39 protein [Thermoanaerobaculia bacterium]|nr:glycosyltransferase family 39 protein [Thermoanaerobaculia bacterium]
MSQILETEVVERHGRSRTRVLAAVGALVLAAGGQLVLERARGSWSRPPILPVVIAFGGAAALAIGLFRRGEYLPGPPRPLEPPRYPRALYLACLPGAVSLGLALDLYVGSNEGDPRPGRLWILGLVLLLLPGLWDWYRRFTRRPAGEGRESRRFIAAAVILFAFAFAIRIWGGIDRIPGWIDSDEGATGIDGRAALAQGSGALFGFWDMGNPRMTLFVSQLAARPFGEGLRALRLGSALLGSLTVVLLFDFGRRLVGSRAAFLAALLLAVNHAFVHWSRVGQIYIDTPFFASLALALLLRVVTGGSFLALIGAGIALAIGAVTYIPTEILPALVVITLLGWAIVLHWPTRRVLPVVAFLAAVVALTCAPVVATILRISPEIAFQRIPAISLLRPEGLRLLTSSYQAGSAGEAIGEHVLRTIGIFNFGSDYFKAYGAHRALHDAVTATLTPVAYALLLSRLSSPVGWLSIVFTGAYLTGGVLFCASPPTYHRISVVLLFSCLAVAWTLVGLARVLAGEVRGRAWRWVPAAAVLAVVGASAWSNLHDYFREEPQIGRLEAGLGVGRLICRYAPTHTVIDATALDGHEYAPAYNQYLQLECPGAKRLRVEAAARLWAFPDMTDAARVALIVPTVAESANPGRPRGYRLVRRSVDRSIRSPADLSLSVLEFERVP